MKLYTEEQIRNAMRADFILDEEIDNLINKLTPIELPSDDEIEEKLNVAYGNGYEQGEMDFYKKMKSQGKLYADGYEEGYNRAIELTKWAISNLIPPHNEQQ